MNTPDRTHMDNGLTVEEEIIENHLSEIYRLFTELNDPDMDDVKSAIRSIQKILARRIVQRIFPEHWGEVS